MENNSLTIYPSLHDWYNRLGNRDQNLNLYYITALEKQFFFFRDVIGQLLGNTQDSRGNYERGFERMPIVIGEHYSKSVRLPVVQFFYPRLVLTMRDNIYDIKVSVDSDQPIPWIFDRLVNPGHALSATCFEGFPEKQIYGAYEDNAAQFSCEFGSHYQVYTFVFLLKRAYDQISRGEYVEPER